MRLINNAILSTGLISRLKNLDLVLVFDGNSLTDGLNNSGQSQYYPNEVRQRIEPLVSSLVFHSMGVSGESTREMLLDVDTRVYPLAETGKTNVLIAWEDANSIIKFANDSSGQNDNKVTPQENFADFEAYFSGATGFDKKILITGYHPRKNVNGFYALNSTVFTDASIDEQEVFFNLVRDAPIYSVPWDYVIDLRDLPKVGGLKGQNEDAAYFADYIHLQLIGYDEIAFKVSNFLKQIL